MLDSAYEFRFLHAQKVAGEVYKTVFRYSFRGLNNQRYLVILEEFDHDFLRGQISSKIAVKF
jgi:predicted RNA-binding protein with EMAP domain